MNEIKVIDNDGKPVQGWRYGTFFGTHLVTGKNPRKIWGWSLVSPDGIERFSEGSFEKFVPFANLVLENYGCRPAFEVSPEQFLSIDAEAGMCSDLIEGRGAESGGAVSPCAAQAGSIPALGTSFCRSIDLQPATEIHSWNGGAL